jgi:CRISPR/Cas system CMR-associated protein Cmr5 small subunit
MRGSVHMSALESLFDVDAKQLDIMVQELSEFHRVMFVAFYRSAHEVAFAEYSSMLKTANLWSSPIRDMPSFLSNRLGSDPTSDPYKKFTSIPEATFRLLNAEEGPPARQFFCEGVQAKATCKLDQMNVVPVVATSWYIYETVALEGKAQDLFGLLREDVRNKLRDEVFQRQSLEALSERGANFVDLRCPTESELNSFWLWTETVAKAASSYFVKNGGAELDMDEEKAAFVAEKRFCQIDAKQLLGSEKWVKKIREAFPES